MAESSARIVLRGDGKELILTAKKAKDAVTDIGKAAGGVGGQFSKMGGELLKTVGRALALKTAVREALQAMQAYNSAAKQASETTGKSVLDRDIAASKLGLSGEEAEALTGQAGPRTREELTGFLSTLATGDNAKLLDKRGIFRAVSAFGSGVISDQEALEAARSGNVDAILSEASRRTAGLTERGRAELDSRRAVNALAARKFQEDSARGDAERIASARVAANAAASPKSAAVVEGLGLMGVADTIQTAISGQTETLTRENRRPAIAPAAQ